MTALEWQLVYLLIAAVFCIWTWIDNPRVRYTMGLPPSGIWTGLFWPFLVVGVLIILVVDAYKNRTPRP